MKTKYGIWNLLVVVLTSSVCLADIIIESPKRFADGAIQVAWNSETNAI